MQREFTWNHKYSYKFTPPPQVCQLVALSDGHLVHDFFAAWEISPWHPQVQCVGRYRTRAFGNPHHRPPLAPLRGSSLRCSCYDTFDPDLVLGVDHLRPHPLNMIVGFFHFCTLCTLELLPPSYHFGLGVFGHQRSDPSCAIGFLHVPT